MIEAYPLQWPVGYKRTSWQQSGRFDTSFGAARDKIVKELRLMGAKDVIISTNVPLRNDGLPYANFKAIQDTGVAVYFTFEKDQMVFCCDKWKKVEDNMQAICKTINSFRMMPQWGVSDMLKRAFTGFKALPEEIIVKQWWETLGVNKNATKDDIVRAYRNLAKVHHPDVGGSHIMFTSINDAYQQGLKNAS
jgi:hypothetical protein